MPSMPLPPLPSTTLASTQPLAETYPQEWRPLGAKPKSPSGTSPPRYDQNGTGSGGDGATNPGGCAPGWEAEVQVLIQLEEDSRQDEAPREAMHRMAVSATLHHHHQLHHSSQEEQVHQEVIQEHRQAHMLNAQLTLGHP